MSSRLAPGWQNWTLPMILWSAPVAWGPSHLMYVSVVGPRMICRWEYCNLKIHLWTFMTFQNGVVFSCFLLFFLAAFPAFAFVAFHASAFTAFSAFAAFASSSASWISSSSSALSTTCNIDNNNDNNNNTKIQNNQLQHQDSTAMRAFEFATIAQPPNPPSSLFKPSQAQTILNRPGLQRTHPTPATKTLKKQLVNLDPPEWNDMDGICLIRFQAIHFSHPFARYRKMQDGQAGRILEINELLEWPSESNPRPAVIAGWSWVTNLKD